MNKFKEKLYGRWAKFIVVLIMIWAALFASLSFMRIMEGVSLGMSFSEMSRKVSYIHSSNAVDYLNTESDNILNDFANSGSYSGDTNAMLYVRNSETGEVYTSEPDWYGLDLTQVKTRYEDLCLDQLYATYDGTVSDGDNPYEITYSLYADESLYYLMQSEASQIQTDLGDGFNQIFLALNTNFPVHDSVAYHQYLLYTDWVWFPVLSQVNVIALFTISLAVLALALVMMAFQTGHVKGDSEIHPAPMDKCPIEIMMLWDVIGWALGSFFLTDSIGGMNSTVYFWYDYSIPGMRDIRNYYIAGTVFTASLIILLAWEIKRYGRRIKERSFGSSLIRFAIKHIRILVRNFRRYGKDRAKLILCFVLFVAAQCVGWTLEGYALWSYAPALEIVLAIVLVLLDLFVIYLLLKNVRGRDEVREGMRQIAAGNLDYQIDYQDLSEGVKPMAEELNSVRDGIKKAVEVEMKSERLKTDLITNVSHDIKTPLTSIINYVDILKRENLEDERLAGYVEILDQKSQRLKQLVEDLVESSKISSGNVTLDMQEINLKELIMQISGEFDERFKERDLTPVLSLPDEDMIITADGMRMCRVLENLYTNAAKYSMPGSRVYINGEVADGKESFSIKNMSENQLNFSADELMERFVRGDVSRTTEGSGLGLEIARNLTTMQGGDLEIYLDGDLFKVTVTF
ncbi:MAG: HAMP domain-containing histidine kinase [Clostridiales bacterium]|nr:HAMP domain-containing histidine kinase [Clostridiales bacterium]